MGLADFMFSPGVQRVLARVYGEPMRTFTLSELIEHAGGGRGNGQRHIQRLLDAGVLSEEPRRGKQRVIRANTDFALYPELQSICTKSFGLLEPIRTALRPFATEISEAFLFGSVAREEDNHRSDIDVMVIGTAPMMALMDAMLKVEAELGRPVHLNAYSPAEWADLVSNDPVVARIAAGSIVRVLPDVPAT
ncbi:nucleotidyltransferase domain-containing protein [Cupriavidus gilardii]|uniref:nucleotidyltransferase domain-containing protein n=1 Tax=Cupriavidus gilardii TaxID=82541 RepID=UPI001ABECF87|nr:nucleotidyltransferase domain-containing protein [Cupriavidus gilardii]MBO4121269.1 nucleotidyltransferase domain-containing protein [Cupriavidus gilardii]